MEHSVIILLASNHEPEKNLREARQCLQQILSCMVCTGEHWTEPVGSPGAPLYLNQLAQATTSLSAEQLTDALKQAERLMGRTADDRQRGVVRIDLDLLQYDGQRYHQRDWERDYVKQLLPELSTAYATRTGA